MPLMSGVHTCAWLCCLMLQILRKQLNCTLPVEVAFVSAKQEMHPDVIPALNASFGPVHGLDLSTAPYPAHHNPCVLGLPAHHVCSRHTLLTTMASYSTVVVNSSVAALRTAALTQTRPCRCILSKLAAGTDCAEQASCAVCGHSSSSSSGAGASGGSGSSSQSSSSCCSIAQLMLLTDRLLPALRVHVYRAAGSAVSCCYTQATSLANPMRPSPGRFTTHDSSRCARLHAPYVTPPVGG